MSDSLGGGTKHLRRGEVDEPVQVRVLLPGELHHVDGGHGVVHHELQRPLNALVHVGPGREVKNHLDGPDILGELPVDLGPQVGVDDSDPPPVLLPAGQDLLQPVDPAGQVQPVQADHVPVRAVQDGLDDVVSHEPRASGHQDGLDGRLVVVLCLGPAVSLVVTAGLLQEDLAEQSQD